jgi:hypothetical protein
MAQAYTRGAGWSAGVPNADIAAVIVTASARLWSHPRQLPVDEIEGQESASWRAGFTGFSVVELLVLDRYRVRAL